MRKFLSHLSIIGILVFIVLAACKKEDSTYPFTVVCKTYNDSISVQGVYVEIYTNVPNGTVYMDGYTDENGQVSFEYNLDATLQIRASRGKRSKGYTWLGCNYIRLQPDQNVYQTVYIKEQSDEDESYGCDAP